MQNASSTKTNKSHTKLYKNPLEAINDMSTSAVKNAADSLGQIADGSMDQLFGYQSENVEYDEYEQSGKSETNNRTKQEFKLFSFNEHNENYTVKQEIQQLTEMIKREIEIFKKQNKSLLDEMNGVHNLVIQSTTENGKSDVYNARFLEFVLEFIKTLRMKATESTSWMQALMSKKKKRGSLFANRTKKMGTQYSLSQELQVTRSVQ